MEKKSFLKTTAGKVVTAAAALVVIAGVVIAVLLLNPNTYRSIIAKGVTGTVNVVGEINNGQAYVGERLYGGDDVSIMAASSLTMLMDNDKYLYADENTHFKLQSDDPDNSSRIRIILDKGSELNELRSSLRTGDSYDVDTPNSTMSVRGTKFRVTVYTEGETVYTLLEVENGVVLARLRTVGGAYTGKEQKFGAGESVLIRGGKDFSEFVNDAGGATVRHLDHAALPTNATARLITLLDDVQEADTPADGNGEGTPAVTDAPVTDPVTDGTSAPETEPVTDGTETSHAVTQTARCEEVGHSYGEWYTTKLPGCVSGGTEARICSVCHNMETRSLPAEGHKFKAWSVVTAATCESDGLETRKCTACKKKETRIIPAAGHKYGDWVTVSSETGGCGTDTVQTRTCAVCGNTETQTIAASGHSFGGWVTEREAGCLTKGLETRTCSVCGAKEQKYIPAAGHKFGSWRVTEEAGCENDGLKVRTCPVCKEKEEEVIAATGHRFGEWYALSEPTCMNTGTDERKCRLCGGSETRTVPAAGHKYSEWKTIKEPGCLSGGTQEATCTVCGHTESVATEPLGHSYVMDPQSGNGVIIWKCQRCGDSYTQKVTSSHASLPDRSSDKPPKAAAIARTCMRTRYKRFI